jgi:hypothetical protein
MLIKLTDQNKCSLLLNPDHVTTIQTVDTGPSTGDTVVRLAASANGNYSYYYVIETVDEIAKLLKTKKLL